MAKRREWLRWPQRGEPPSDAAMAKRREWLRWPQRGEVLTDVAMAKVAGAVGVLVLTGEATAGDVKNCPTPPDVVVADLRELEQLLRHVNRKGLPRA